jgi:hypothetical protein
MDHDAFLERLKDPLAAPLVTDLKSFLEEFRQTPRLVNTQRKRVLGFIARASAASLANPAFAQDSTTAKDDDKGTSWEESLVEGWEKLVLTRVYELVFPATEEEGPNAILSRRLESLNWVSEKHLDLPFPVELDAAGKELCRLSEFKAPRDKLNLLLNTSQLVADLVKRASPGSAGNDYLLPALILVILRARPASLISHVKFIMRFRNQEKLNAGATQYCITNMVRSASTMLLLIFTLCVKDGGYFVLV